MENEMPTTQRPILALDFDGVCHSYTSAWVNVETIPDPPVPGLFEFLESAMEHFRIAIFSTRSRKVEGRKAMQDWFHEHAALHYFDHPQASALIEQIDDGLEYPVAKPAAFLMIDDRALTFNGYWPDIDQLQSFKPWNEHLKVRK